MKPRLVTKKVFQTLDYVIKLIWRKSMSINYIFVGQHVCKQAHTHAKLYRTHTVLHLLRLIFLCVHCTALTKQLQIVKGARAHHLAIYSSSVSRLPSAMSALSHTEICQQLDFIVIIAGRLIPIVWRIFTGISQTIRYRPSLVPNSAWPISVI